MSKKRFLKQSIFLIILSIISGVVYNLFSDGGIPYIYKTIEIDSGQVISLEKAYQLFIEGRALFVDTRTEEEYAESHIKNAINIPAHSSMDELVLFAQNSSLDRIHITYCDGLECSDSKRMANILMQIGFENVLIFFGGWEEWENNNYPREKGKVNETKSDY